MLVVRGDVAGGGSGDHQELARLTARELEVVRLLVEGLTDAQIAARLAISVRTVQSHVRGATAKTGTGTRGELAAKAVRGGIGSPGAGIG
jgi:DNA-binding CsgD family transcriptional regulator